MARVPAVRLCGIVAAAATLFGLLGAACHADRDLGAEESSATVRVILSPHLSWGPLVLAEELGYFADEGIDVEFVTLLRTEESLIALLSGEVDVLPGPLHPGLLTAIARGANVRIVAGMNYLARTGCTYQAILLRPGLSPEQAAGQLRRVEASRDGSSRYLASRMLATQGIEIDSLETIRLPTPVVVNSLNEGAVDAAALTEPTVTRASRTATVWLRSEDATPDFQWGVLSVGDRLLRREPELGARFLAAYRRGIARFNQGKIPDNLTALQAATGEDRATLDQSCWPTFRPDGRINLASILEYQAWALGRGYIDQGAAPDKLWDSTLVAASDSVLRLARVEE